MNGADRQSGMQLPMPNLSKIRRLVMLPIIFLLADKGFPIIYLLEKTSGDLGTPWGGGQLPNPKECNSTLTSATREKR